LPGPPSPLFSSALSYFYQFHDFDDLKRKAGEWTRLTEFLQNRGYKVLLLQPKHDEFSRLYSGGKYLFRQKMKAKVEALPGQET